MARTTIVVIFLMMAVVISTSVAGPVRKSVEMDAKTAALLAANPQLKFLGRLGNKQYYAYSEYISWEEADLYCKSLGFELITFDIRDERFFIREATRSGHYWTSALVKWENEDISVIGNRARFDAGSVSGAGEVYVVPGESTGYPLCQVAVA